MAADAPRKPAPGDADYRPEERRAAVPLAMVHPICQRENCTKAAQFVPVAVFRPSQAAVVIQGAEDYDVRTPLPSCALCSKHADELTANPDMLITDDGWTAMRQGDLRAGRSPRDRNRLTWELVQIPQGEAANQIGAAMRAEGMTLQ